jgi:hypothetical protein
MEKLVPLPAPKYVSVKVFHKEFELGDILVQESWLPLNLDVLVNGVRYHYELKGEL